VAADNSRETIASYSVPTRHVWCLISLGELSRIVGRVKKRLVVSFLLLSALGLPRLADPQESQRTLLLEVTLTTTDISRTETLVYLRVFSDGSAEAQSDARSRFSTLALRKAQISSSELGTLRELLRSFKVQHFGPQYNRYWGSVEDFGQTWQIAIVGSDSKKSIVLHNFQPFLARNEKEPYPAEVENLAVLSGSYERR